MKLFYDYQIFEHQKYGGISRYYYELLKGIESSKDTQFLLPLLKSDNHYLSQMPSIASQLKGSSDFYKKFMWGIEFPGKWLLYKQRNKYFPQFISENRKHTINALKNQAFDIFHPTDLDDYFLEYIGSRPFVVTVHDMIDEYFPEYSFHVHSTYKTSVKERLINKAAGIIAVSESTKAFLLQRFSIQENKIRVIYHGYSELSNSADLSKPIIDGEYLLFVGKRVHYKNFYFLLQCIKPLLKKYPDLKIVCVGSPFNTTEKDYLIDLGLDGNVFHVNADDSTLGNLYCFAKAFVYPSLQEGFGMPILEAFNYNCPVLLSDNSSLPEVAGDAALYFNAKDISSVQQAILKILTDTKLRDQLIEKGRDRLKLFSWQNTVNQTLDFYRSLL
ncbi:MAG TPA: glycosyltransferase family 1 protein [Cyclobacteriaceae bacterium]